MLLMVASIVRRIWKVIAGCSCSASSGDSENAWIGPRQAGRLITISRQGLLFSLISLKPTHWHCAYGVRITCGVSIGITPSRLQSQPHQLRRRLLLKLQFLSFPPRQCHCSPPDTHPHDGQH
jgi:hypothetical protein